MARLTFRPFQKTEADYTFLADLWNENFPNQPESARQIRFADDALDPKYVHERFLGELDGQPVASGTLIEPFWSYEPGKFFVTFMLRKALHGKGLEAQVFDFLLEKLGRFELRTLIASAREDETEKRRLYAERGIRETMRFPVSYLEVPVFDPGPYQGLREKLKNQGIQVATAAELAARDPDFHRKWYEFDWVITQDVPLPDPPTKIPFKQFEKWLKSPTYMPEGVFFALDQEELVGITGLWRNDADEKYLSTGLTGVRRSHRRRGIATMLKVEAIKFAKQYGAEKIETDNEENNPMYQLNLQLGYKPAPAWMDYEKKFE